MRAITEKQFNAYCFFKTALSREIYKEVAWYEVNNKKLLATIVLDNIDKVYNFVILGRDTNRIFRCIEISTNFGSFDIAHEQLLRYLKRYENDGLEFYSQGDERKVQNQIFVSRFPDNELHPYFKKLRDDKQYDAARELIKEIIYSYKKEDINNFISDFQKKFDARLWELLLYMYFYNTGFEIILKYDVPDFHLQKSGEEFFVEATTTNPHTEDQNHNPALKNINLLIYKYYCSLKAKLKKRYWEKRYVKGIPLIIAIEDFGIPASGNTPSSHLISSTPITQYLYGIEIETKPFPMIKLRANHTWKKETFPSNFFSYPDAENVSAVLFSNQGTITKFNRMGKLAGLGGNDVKMIRQGFYLNPDPKALKKIPFTVDIDSPNYEETWTEGLEMFHNPDAKHPVNPDCFPGISHIFFDKATNEIYEKREDKHIISSCTIILPIEEE